MSGLAKQIGEVIEEIANKQRGRNSYPVMSGVVKGVDVDAMTCEVLLSTDEDDAATDGVLLNVVLEGKGGFYHVPAVDALCVVAEVNGGGLLELLKASVYDRVYVKGGGKFIDIKDSVVLLNGDGNGGLVQIAELKENLDTLKNYIKNTLEPAIGSGFTAVGAAMASSGAAGKLAFDALVQPSLITIKDMENKNVKHG
jgi:hypothetical protein